MNGSFNEGDIVFVVDAFCEYDPLYGIVFIIGFRYPTASRVQEALFKISNFCKGKKQTEEMFCRFLLPHVSDEYVIVNEFGSIKTIIPKEKP